MKTTTNTATRLLVGLTLTAAISCTPAVRAGSEPEQTTPAQQQPAQNRVWPVITRIHVDLWLHGYAVLLRDTSTVPVFRRGYREAVQASKSSRSITTRLDDNRARLQARLTTNPALINGQFAPLYFATWDQMQQVIASFLRAQGDPRAAGDQTLAQYFAVLASQFPSALDRDWLSVFVESLEDERRKFYQEYWTSQNGQRMAVIRRVDSLWQGTYRQKLTRYLNNTRQENGDFVLGLTVGGEGRAVNFGPRQNAVVSTMPEQNAEEAFYVFAHEVTSAIVGTAVNDNTTPQQQRDGVSGVYITTGQVRAGAILLQRAAPELQAGYIRYYLAQAGQPTTGDINARFATVFPLPDLIRQAIERQLEVVLGGI
jgi:hypothetical protein